MAADNRRQHIRRNPDPPEVAVLHTIGMPNADAAAADLPGTFFVDLINKTPAGAFLRTTASIPVGLQFHLEIYDAKTRAWELSAAEVRWVHQDSGKPGFHQLRIAFLPQEQCRLPGVVEGADKVLPTAEDYEFFRGVDLLKRIDRDAVCPMLNRLVYKHVKAGERFITQGDEGDSCFVIQFGACCINVESEGKIHRVTRRHEGEIVGEMALLTGEPRSAHVDAETNMELWQLSRADFEHITRECPELRSFLTEIIAGRFAAATKTAERKIGKYLITDVIGRGGFSIVYKGLHKNLNMPVAIKMLNHDMAMDAEFKNGFTKEARIIARFNHENIIKVYDIESLYQTMFIIMEYIEGQSLRAILEDMGTLSPRSVVHYLRQICAGLQYAHERDIIHQDIKPGNIFVLPSNAAKILDFGLACPCGTENAMTGTPFYMSPEQVECLPVDERTDIYALGIMVFEMLAGKRPFPEDDAHAVMDMHVDQDIPDPAEFIPDIPPVLRSFILKACARDIGQRYRNIPEILQDLQPLVEEYALNGNHAATPNRKMATLFMIYTDEQQLALNKLMEEFSSKVQELGVVFKAADFTDV